MAVHCANLWEILHRFPDGSLVRAATVFDDSRCIGRVVDLAGTGYRADFVDRAGDVQEITLPDFYTAIMRLAEEARGRYRHLN